MTRLSNSITLGDRQYEFISLLVTFGQAYRWSTLPSWCLRVWHMSCSKGLLLGQRSIRARDEGCSCLYRRLSLFSVIKCLSGPPADFSSSLGDHLLLGGRQFPLQLKGCFFVYVIKFFHYAIGGVAEHVCPRRCVRHYSNWL